MKRYLILASVAVAAVLGVGGCASSGSPTDGGAPSASATADPNIAARQDACVTVKAARDKTMEAMLNAAVAFSDPETGDEMLAAAIGPAKAALQSLKPEMVKAAGQTTDAALKDALTRFAGTIDGAVAAIEGAGTDRTKLQAALTGGFGTTEQQILNLCSDVWLG